ncbi:MAG: ATP-binding protein [Paracoccus sp. (in: a-proteobacteria)]|nr:ATP-binding protein [Paracoccus sp. (in: a-proteobacteria)]
MTRAAEGTAVFAHSLRAEPLDVREALRAMADCLSRTAPDDLLGRAELVLAEIMNNVGEHGQAGVGAPFIHLCIGCDAAGLIVGLCDTGTELPLSCLAANDLPGVRSFPEGGFGWFLIRDLTESLRYFREGRRNYLSFTIDAIS